MLLIQELLTPVFIGLQPEIDLGIHGIQTKSVCCGQVSSAGALFGRVSAAARAQADEPAANFKPAPPQALGQ
jgi:hypothetical protein